jgi:hypothetical protein
MAGISASLERRLRTADPGELVDVVLELQTVMPPAAKAGTPRSEHYAAVEQRFADAGQHVREFIRDRGGEVIGTSWLASAIRARVPAAAITELQALDRVALLDVPQSLTRD